MIRDARERLGGFFVEHSEPLKERDKDVHVRVSHDGVRIEILWLRQVAEKQRLSADTFLNGGLASGAGKAKNPD